MSGIVISPKTKSEYKLLHELLKKLGINSAPLSASEMEDLGLSFLMKKVDRSKKVSRDTIMKKLKA